MRRDVRKLLLVGQAFGPSIARDGPDFSEKFVARYALTGRAGRRLAGLAGMTMNEYLRGFERTNLIRRYPGSAGRGDAFPMPEAKVAAMMLRRELGGKRVVLLGRKVAEAFGYGKAEWFAWNRGFARGVEFAWAVFPHPSGVNHWWNDFEYVRRAEKFMRGLAGKG
jgi:hypothetical protein